MKKHRRKRLLSLGLFLLATLILVPTALALEGLSEDEVIIGPDEVIEDDLYVGAQRLVMDGTIRGDLLAFGGTIEINGTVEGDLMLAGQSVVINGAFADDARLAGYALTIGEDASIGSDVLAFGYSLETKAGSLVQGDAFFACSQALLAGEIAADLVGGANGVLLNGPVGGSAELDLGAEGSRTFSPWSFSPNAPELPNVPGGLSIGENGSIAGDLDYTSQSELDFPTERIGGQVTRHKEALSEADQLVSKKVDLFPKYLRRFAALLLVGLLLLAVAPKGLNRIADTALARPLKCLGRGALCILAFVLALLTILATTLLLTVLLHLLTLGNLMWTVGGLGLLALSLLSGLFGLTASYVTQIAVGYLGGRWILSQIKDKWGQQRYLALLLGLLILVPLSAIPCAGQIVNLLVNLLGLGALWILALDVLRQRHGFSFE
ncbi:MAG: hypothetical protein JXA37_12030 [Chloroflexia bacterium]|nr:hypothetical protein [Chloroflexia bacterium]